MFRVIGQMLGSSPMAEGERGSEQEVLELSLKEFTRKVTRERMFLVKDVALVKVLRPERV